MYGVSPVRVRRIQNLAAPLALGLQRRAHSLVSVDERVPADASTAVDADVAVIRRLSCKVQYSTDEVALPVVCAHIACFCGDLQRCHVSDHPPCAEAVSTM